jgi:endo-1,4-beta-xylanase
MSFKLLRGLLVTGLLLGVNMVLAQDSATPESAPETTPLRALAARDNLYVGAAVYTTHLTTPAHAETLAREFNMLTPENEAKACETQPQFGRFDFRGFDQLVAFAEAHDMQVHGHTLVWHQCVPSWLLNGQYTRDTAIGLLRDHIYTEVGRYKGRVMIWDVVNEAFADSGSKLRDTPWRRLIGDDYVELAFRFAREADPDALLFYNDFNIEAVNAKSNAVYAMVQDFQARGVPIDGIGFQAHSILGTINAGSMARNMQRFGELGLQVQITEADVRYDGSTTDTVLQRQAADYASLLTTCLASPYCTAFITWGVSDRFTWLRSPGLGFFENPTVAPLLFDDDYQPKPAYFAVRDALAAGRPAS